MIKAMISQKINTSHDCVLTPYQGKSFVFSSIIPAVIAYHAYL